MGLFDFLRTPERYEHPRLGSLLYSGSRWRGIVELERGQKVTLFVPGARGGPIPEALLLAEHVPESWLRVRADLEKDLFEHYSAGRDGGVPDLPDIANATDVWSHVTLSSVEIRPHRSLDEFQVAMRTAWDDEHTLGALVRDGTLAGLNGSILEPR
jgi:hypothetical protein